MLLHGQLQALAQRWLLQTERKQDKGRYSTPKGRCSTPTGRL
jgi:hypothetical protein